MEKHGILLNIIQYFLGVNEVDVAIVCTNKQKKMSRG